jgi:hypothetical protein
MATPAAFAMGAPPPDATVATQIDQQFQQATQAEQTTISQAPATAATAAPSTIALGQTMDQVVGILGQPKNIVDLGAKKIYVYQDLKITFNNGQVSDVE